MRYLQRALVAGRALAKGLLAPDRQVSRQLAALPRVGGMSTIPTRLADLERVLQSIVPQVDRLHLFFHGHEAIPEFARHPKILPILAPRSDPFRASGKFYGLTVETSPCLYFTFDDDIIYPPTHVAYLARRLAHYKGRAIVGIHGDRFRAPYLSYKSDRKAYLFTRRLRRDRRVDVLGAGTAAFVSDALPIDPRTWPYGDMDDLMLAMEAERRGLRRIALRRRAGQLQAIAMSQPDSIWASTKLDDSRQSVQMGKLLRLMRGLPDEA